jgi:acyl-CoA reductase-like NAD-dependent aldehyde dehydrogenase
LDFRKRQLQQLINLLTENTDAVVESLHKDLRKPKIETVIGEISAVVDECQFMIKVPATRDGRMEIQEAGRCKLTEF